MKININGIPFEIPDGFLGAFMNPQARQTFPSRGNVERDFLKAFQKPVVDRIPQVDRKPQVDAVRDEQQKEKIYKAILSLDRRIGDLESMCCEKVEESEEEKKFQKELKKKKTKPKKK